MIYPKLYSETDNGRWIDVIDPKNPENELKQCIYDAIKRINFLEDFKIVFDFKIGTFTPKVRFERINER
jgi:hypothetical protein